MHARAGLVFVSLFALTSACREERAPRPPTPAAARPTAARDAATPPPAPDAGTGPVTVIPVPADMPHAAPTLEAGHPLAPGCFGWSPSTHSAACVVGSLGRDEAPGRAWGVRFTGDAPEQSVSLAPDSVGVPHAAPRSIVPEAATLTALRARLTSESYVTLTPLRHAIDSRDALTWAPGATVRWLHARGATASTNATDLIEMRWGGDAGTTVLEAWVDRAVPAPALAMYLIPGGRYLVLEAVGDYGDDGGTGTIARAWTCDRETHTCQ